MLATVLHLWLAAHITRKAGQTGRLRRKYQGRLDPARLVFVDETWAKTNMAPLRGWAPIGERLHAKVPMVTGAP